MPNLIVLFGPPASGKAAVGHELSQLTGYRFFHNHLTTDPAAALFGWGGKRFSSMVNAVRDLLLAEAATDRSIPGVIFTCVWALDDPQEAVTLQRYAALFEATGGKAYFAEMRASLETRIQREGTPFRMSLKPAKRDVEAAKARQVEIAARYRMNTDDGFPLRYPHLIIDTEQHTPSAAAREIKESFSLLPCGDA